MPQLPADHAPHADHDALLVSAWVAGDVDANERRRAEALIESCTDCAQLAADLRAIAAALPASGVPARPRDFRLTDADLHGVRKTGPRWSLDGLRRALRPAGAGLATLGIAGLLLAGLTGLGGPGQRILSNVGSPVSAPAAGGAGYGEQSGASAAGPVPAASGAAGGPSAASASPASSPALGPEVVSTPPPSAAATGSPGSDKNLDSGVGLGPTPPPAAPAGPSPLVVGSVAALVVGLVLLVAGQLVRRLAGPAT
jgi:hypothetical protein